MSTPKVTVSIITYNQRPFIEECVMSALRQRTNFPYEVFVGDDLSTDGTREWLIAKQKEYPDKLRLDLHATNMGAIGKGNLASTILRARGSYVSLLEGDDYYDSDTKLQQQADYLDANPDVCGCCHDAWTLFPDGRRGDFPTRYPEGTQRITLEMLFHYGFPHTTTLMLRKTSIPEFPDWYFKVIMSDWPIIIRCAEAGPWGYLEGRRLTTYRLHSSNSWMGIDTTKRALKEIESYEVFDNHLKGKYHKSIQRMINHRHFVMSQAYAEAGNIEESRRWFWKFITGYGRNHLVSDRIVAQHLLRLIAPGVFRRWQNTKAAA